jgi:hypothetical protein
MSHDLAAELAGYRDELSRAEQYGNKGRAAAVRAEVARVESLLSDGSTPDASADAEPPASERAVTPKGRPAAPHHTEKG